MVNYISSIQRALLHHWKDYLLPIVAGILFLAMQHEFIVPSFHIVLAICIAPFVFHIQSKVTGSMRYAILCLAFLALYAWLEINVLLFMCCGSLLLFTIEYRFGKIGWLPFFFLICISSALNYVIHVSTFSIRLELSQLAGQMLNAIGHTITLQGTSFQLDDGSSFSVDDACVGLKLFNTGLSVMVLLLGFAQQRQQKSLSILALGMIFLSTLLLLIATNLLRIVVIVMFRSEAGSASHEIIGLFSLLMYTIIPLHFIIGFSIKRFGKSFEQTSADHNFGYSKYVAICVALVFTTTATFAKVRHQHENFTQDDKLAQLNLEGFTRLEKLDGVIQFSSPNALVYIKPANKGYESDHPPSLCWQSAGFALEEIMEKEMGTHRIWFAKLKRDATVQYTAWWYDNGINKTIDQWHWRLDKGEPYRIVNITTRTPQELEKTCAEFLSKKLF